MYKKIAASLTVFLAFALIIYIAYNANNKDESKLSIIELSARKNKSPESYRKKLLELYETQPITEEGVIEERALKDVSLDEYNTKIEDILTEITDQSLKASIQSLAAFDRPILELNQEINSLKTMLENTTEYISGILVKVHKIDDKLAALNLSRSYKDLTNTYQKWSKQIQEQATPVPDRVYGDPDLGKFLNTTTDSDERNNQATSSHFVVLTFDDGPNPYTTPQILDILKAHNVKATFFVLGQNAEQYPEIIKRIHDEGHIVGNHSYSHRNYTLISDADILYELNHTNEIIENVTHDPVRYYRMPYGAGGQREMQLTQMTPVLWNVDSEDWKSRNEQAIINRVVATLLPSPVILMHDIYQESANSLGAVIENVQANGYQFVRMDEMM
ncbi:polysaccharide deacetylase family protein [Facklamia sp. 7083-14-GEN3]|uniref:polysaccharide deacetylase family protein n=1 Tax=Facklamia sp. 7083-14-GEN3 TaxID=2973478 RepID=UPI00215BCFEC|nr:polysaccharide deacetylase family protein [Facklamia sp. 7083-14-GEN3]MCR8969610.1 polysaccharide deacetylase family protein [Facklamia sp. 7083-14-GEN3]